MSRRAAARPKTRALPGCGARSIACIAIRSPGRRRNCRVRSYLTPLAGGCQRSRQGGSRHDGDRRRQKGREPRQERSHERSRGDPARHALPLEDDERARGQKQQREGWTEHPSVSRPPAGFARAEESLLGQGDAENEEKRDGVGREEEKDRLLDEPDLGRRGCEPSPGPLLEEWIAAEARVVVGVGQEKEEDSEEERGREEQGGLAQEAHVPFDSNRIPRCYRFVS